ncbi:MAG: hypothetical protein Q4D51_01565 [Eubacteriales bacterium]|nr:hypothetical protein [Eubacteriales bacterium]
MKWIRRIRKVLALLSETIVAYIILITINALFIRKELNFVVWLVLFGIFSVCYIVRDVAKRNFVLIVASIPVCVAIWMLPYHFTIKGIFVIAGGFQLLSSYRYMGNERRISPALDSIFLYVFTCAISLIYGTIIHHEPLISKLTVAAIELIVLFLAQHYLDGMMEYINCSQEYKPISIRGMLYANTITVLAVSAIFVILLLINRQFDLLGLFVNAMINGIRFLLRMIHLEDSTLYIPDLELEEETPEEIPDALEYTDRWGVYFVWMIIGAFFISVCIVLMIKLGRFLMQKTNDSGDVVERISTKKKEKGERIAGKKRERKLFLSKAEKVRKYYRKKIYQYQNDISLDAYQTCGQLQQEIQTCAQVDIQELSNLYEQVRYGAGEVNEDMVKKAKKYATKD